ncbi:hypothetical protein CR205_03845 [Alteribacter lacisalsi]|uniref:Uncharacterized protein n=1 Tax=Alteribacter lacisalsi TaxID=2045244 RepID=A0A2W0HAB4_9BACI|nr:hypothetical protein [Alteribacter lacisalsi]PYZ97736.1 hypothetical protein CR205_03845 [Alteribacter lacisalsi]
MTRQWTISELERKGGALVVRAETKETKPALETLEAGRRMLADSDAKTLIYVIEDDSSFTYIRFPSASWEALQDVRPEGLPVILELLSSDKSSVSLPLEDFWAEVDYLVENIEGNANYGEDMIEAVEKAFQTA